MDHMSKVTLLLGVCLLLSACVVYAPTYVNNDWNMMVHHESVPTLVERKKEETIGTSERGESNTVKPRKQFTLADCGEFTLPREAQKPKYITDLDLVNIEDLLAFDRMLGLKMKELQTHIDTIHSKYEQAHRKWMDDCMVKYSAR